MKKCLTCGFDNKNDNAFCSSCGGTDFSEPYSTDDSAAPAVNVNNQPPMMPPPPRRDDVPRVPHDATLSELMREMTHKGLGASAIADADGRVLGIFTDGDLRRLVETGRDLRALTAREVMHPDPHCIAQAALAAEAAALMEQRRVTVLLAVDEAGQLVGALNSNDLMRAKVI